MIPKSLDAEIIHASMDNERADHLLKAWAQWRSPAGVIARLTGTNIWRHPISIAGVWIRQGIEQTTGEPRISDCYPDQAYYRVESIISQMDYRQRLVLMNNYVIRPYRSAEKKAYSCKMALRTWHRILNGVKHKISEGKFS